MTSRVANVVLLVGVVVLGLLMAEGAARVDERLPLTSLTLPERVARTGLDTTAERLDEVPRAAGVDRSWFFRDPPPLPNRKPVPQEWIDLDRELEHRHATQGSQFMSRDALKMWNSVFVGDPCRSDFFSAAPGWLLTYDSPDGLRYPRFRFLPNITTPSGLVTNEFGWRGPPVTFARSENSIRIVFVGGSTVADAHQIPYSFPEFVAYWLDLWAAANRPDIRFEVMSAARESVDSKDIEAIVRQEVVPLLPDMVVYHEGGNQFTLRDIVSNVAQTEHPSATAAPDSTVSRWLNAGARHSDLVRRLRTLVAASQLPNGGGELTKPDYEISWPQGLDERDPDLSRTDLPANLGVILRDLDSIRAALDKIDSELVLTSFMWLVKDGMVLDPIRNRMAWEYLNHYHFPYRYRDIERVAAFQNRVLAKYAAAHDIPFIDVAGKMPFDPDLFADAIHTTYPGTRLKAWVVLQQLLPIIEKQLASGALPRPVPAMGDKHPAFTIAPRKITVDCQKK